MSVEIKLKVGDSVRIKEDKKRGYVNWVQKLRTLHITEITKNTEVYVEEVGTKGYLYYDDLELVNDPDIVGILNKEI
jgi:hypothetical protein